MALAFSRSMTNSGSCHLSQPRGSEQYEKETAKSDRVELGIYETQSADQINVHDGSSSHGFPYIELHPSLFACRELFVLSQFFVHDDRNPPVLLSSVSTVADWPAALEALATVLASWTMRLISSTLWAWRLSSAPLLIVLPSFTSSFGKFFRNQGWFFISGIVILFQG